MKPEESKTSKSKEIQLNAFSLVSLEEVKDGHRYQFIMEQGVPLGQCYDVLHSFLRQILERSKEAVDKTERPEKVKESKDVEKK